MTKPRVLKNLKEDAIAKGEHLLRASGIRNSEISTGGVSMNALGLANPSAAEIATLSTHNQDMSSSRLKLPKTVSWHRQAERNNTAVVNPLSTLSNSKSSSSSSSSSRGQHTATTTNTSSGSASDVELPAA